MKLLLELSGAKPARHVVLTEGEYRLGRGVNCDIVINAKEVSREHALLERRGASYVIKDLGSSNHVYVNGEQVQEQALVTGDVINVSKSVTMFYLQIADPQPRSGIDSNAFSRLKKVMNRIASLNDLHDILRTILLEAIQLVDAERGFIGLVGSSGQFGIDISVNHKIPIDDDKTLKAFISSSAVHLAVEKREPVLFLHREGDSGKLSKSMLQLNLQAVMCSPLLYEDKLVGVLYVDSGDRLIRFDAQDQLFFSMLVDQAAICIENAKLYAESEERYRQLVELSPEAIMIVDDGIIRFANRAAVLLFGCDNPSQLLDKSIETFLTVDVLSPSGSVPVTVEEKLSRLDGRTVDIEIMTVHAPYQGRSCLMFIARDITNRRKFEGELLKAQRLESISTLAGGLAHDFNNILAAVLGNISIASFKLAKGDVRGLGEILRNSEKACERARSLTRQLLTFARGGAPVREVTSISEMLVDTVSLILRGSKTLVEFNIPPDLWNGEVDTGQIAQVFSNLAQNAVEAMVDGGKLIVSAENIVVDSGRAVYNLSGGQYIRICFTDEGDGIPVEVIPSIFDPYFSTRNGGTGLGLSTAYSIIKRHDGLIRVDSVQGMGTTFEIYIPATEKAVKHEDDADSAVRIKKGRVLVMDDDPDVLHVIHSMLELFEMDVALAGDGAKALDLFNRGLDEGRPFDLVIMDLTVPGGMGGAQVLPLIRERDKDVTAIVTSGYSNAPVLSNYQQYGFDGVLEKPFSFERIEELLSRFLPG